MPVVSIGDLTELQYPNKTKQLNGLHFLLINAFNKKIIVSSFSILRGLFTGNCPALPAVFYGDRPALLAVFYGVLFSLEKGGFQGNLFSISL